MQTTTSVDYGYLRDLVLLGTFIGGYPSDAYRAISSGMLASLATNSAAMQSINTGVRAISPLPPFAQVAGQHALPEELDSDFRSTSVCMVSPTTTVSSRKRAR